MTDIWPELPPASTQCYCHHPMESHEGGTGYCTRQYYGEACNCHRYRNLAEIRKARREEAFWQTIGGHDW